MISDVEFIYPTRSMGDWFIVKFNDCEKPRCIIFPFDERQPAQIFEDWCNEL